MVIIYFIKRVATVSSLTHGHCVFILRVCVYYTATVRYHHSYSAICMTVQNSSTVLGVFFVNF